MGKSEKERICPTSHHPYASRSARRPNDGSPRLALRYQWCQYKIRVRLYVVCPIHAGGDLRSRPPHDFVGGLRPIDQNLRSYSIMRVIPPLPAILCCSMALADGDGPSSAENIKRIIVDPPTVDLIGKNARFSMLVHGETNDGRLIDLTRRAEFRSHAPQFVDVSAKGKLFSRADGPSRRTRSSRWLTRDG